MAQVSFGNISANMMQYSNWYGIAPLQAFDTFLTNFVPVSEQTPVTNDTAIQVVEYDASNNTIVVTFTGNMPALTVSNIEIIANGVKVDYGGSFSIDTYNNDIYGTATSISASYSANGALIASLTGVSIYMSLADAGQPLQNYAIFYGNDSIDGGGGNDYLSGFQGADFINGGGGNDTLVGGDGGFGGGDGSNDTLAGGLGDDTYFVFEAGDVIVENPAAGSDTVHAAISYTLGANVENLILGGYGLMSGTGNALDNTITVENNGNNLLSGAGGNDTLIGGIGNDTLNGGIGNDSMAGGAGNDAYFVDASGDIVTENPGAGTDTVNASASFTLGANLENIVLTGAGGINGTGNELANQLTGNSAANELRGELGNDTLKGGGGADTLIGGAGDDTYVIGNVGETLIEQADQGNDIVLSSISYQLGANLENLTLTGNASLTGRGNELNNLIRGNAGNNWLDGGTGADTLAGGLGNDTYVVNSVDDQARENPGEGTDVIRSSVSYSLSANIENLTLLGTANLSGTGNNLANVLTGNAGNNALNGKDGNDSLIGGSGNDTLDGGIGFDTLSGGTGDDIYIIGNGLVPGGYQTVAAYLDLASSGSAYTRVSTSDTGVWHATLGDQTGDGFIDYLTVSYSDSTNPGHFLDLSLATTRLGSNLADGTYLNAERAAFASSGHPGLDFDIDGGGYSTLSGSFTIYDIKIDYTTGTPVLLNLDAAFSIEGIQQGQIHYSLSSTPDVIQESAGEGNDTVKSSITYTLGANLENLVLTGGAYIDGTGNELDNRITGNSGNNLLAGGDGSDTLDGQGGSDTMTGGAGNDTYVVNAAGDVVTENPGEGTDLVKSYIGYSLGANVENLTLLGTADRYGNGNALDNVLTGNAGANILNGLGGNDTMAGGAGNDTYVVNAAGDVVTENPGEGVDLVKSYISYTLGANIENLTLLGAASLSGTGNALGNVLTGNAGNNVLNGGDGNDTLVGGAGCDHLTGGSGADIFSFAAVADSAAGTSRDVITDFGADDRIDLSAIDGDTLTPGIQGFVLTTGGTFSGVLSNPGELYFDETNKILYGNVDGNTQADFSIKVNLVGIATLTDANLILA